MFIAALRVLGVCTLAAVAVGFAAAQESDPEFDGKKMSQWVSIVQNDTSARKRALAVQALGNIWTTDKKADAIQHVAISLRSDKSAAVRAEAAIVLAGLREADMEKYGAKTLVDVLKSETESRVRKEIITAMSKFPAVCVVGVESLSASLKDPDIAVKIAAAEALALAGPKAKTAAAELAPLLNHREKSVRIAAAFALGRIAPDGAATIAETMAAMLGTEKDLDIKRELIASIGLLAEKSDLVVKALTARLFDSEDEVRRAATRTLGTFGTAAASAANDLLKVSATDKVKDIRVDAVRAFGSALGPTGLKSRLLNLRPLLDPSKSPDFEVRLALIDEIGALGYEHLGSDLVSPNKEVKAAAMETMVALRLRLADPQVKVREAAGIAIRKIEKKPEPKK